MTLMPHLEVVHRSAGEPLDWEAGGLGVRGVVVRALGFCCQGFRVLLQGSGRAPVAITPGLGVGFEMLRKER